MWLPPETTTRRKHSYSAFGKKLNSNWKCKKKGYSKLVKRHAQDSRCKCVFFVVTF